MITGDNKHTALAIGKECGLIGSKIEKYTCMEGQELHDLVGGLVCLNCNVDIPCKCKKEDVKEGVRNINQFRLIRDQLKILAKSKPQDKYLLVSGLREFGDIVAVTGDGNNDAPALKRADVGFAMGKSGTDVCKLASDIIILDDNFASIVKACVWGRNIYLNIR